MLYTAVNVLLGSINNMIFSAQLLSPDKPYLDQFSKSFQASPQLPGGHMTVTSWVGRLKIGDDAVLAGTVSNGGSAHLTYFQKCTENLQIGVEAETNFKMGEATCSLGYQFDLPKGNVLMRGSLDTDLVAKAVLEKKLAPLPFTLALCGLLNHRKNQYQFGMGLIIG